MYGVQLWDYVITFQPRKVMSRWYKNFEIRYSGKFLVLLSTSEIMTFILRWKQLQMKSGDLLRTQLWESTASTRKSWSDLVAWQKHNSEKSSESEALWSVRWLYVPFVWKLLILFWKIFIGGWRFNKEQINRTKNYSIKKLFISCNQK